MRFEKAEQLLQLAEMMQATSEGISLSDIQEHFGVGRRTAERMRDAVMRQFHDVEECRQDDRTKRWRLRPSALKSFFYPGTDDLLEFKTAIDGLRQDNLHQHADNMDRLWNRLRGAVRPEHARRIDTDLEALLEAEGHAMRPGPRPRICPDVLSTLRESLKSCRAVEITYNSRIKREESKRVVYPHGFLYGKRHYLVALCKNNAEIRNFSLPNITAAKLLDDYYTRDTNFDLTKYAHRSFGIFQEEPQETVWRFSPEAAADAKEYLFHPSQQFEPQPDGSLIVRFTCGGHQEMCWHLFTWGDSVDILAPQSLIDTYKNMIESVASKNLV